jgi:hypothetical protein
MNGGEEERAGSLNNSHLKWMEVPGIASQLPNHSLVHNRNSMRSLSNKKKELQRKRLSLADSCC